jgi:hypothetical protein
MRTSIVAVIVVALAFLLTACNQLQHSAAPPDLTRLTDKGALEPIPPDQRSDYEIALLLRLAAATPADEVYALLRQSTWGGPARIIEVSVAASRATLRVKDADHPERHFARDLSPAELESLRKLATESDRLPPLAFQAYDGVDYYFVHGAAATGLRRLHINNPPVDDDIPKVTTGDTPVPDPLYAKLVLTMRDLAAPDRLTIHYDLPRPPPGMEVIFAGPDEYLHNVWARGQDVRVTVGPPYYYGNDNWQRLRDGKLAGEVARPDVFADRPYPEDAARARGLLYHLDGCDNWQAQANGRSVHGLRDALYGSTWLFQQDKQPEKLFDATARYPILTPDGRWLVAVSNDQLIRYDLEARKTFALNDPPELARFLPLRRVPDTQKVLLVRHNPTPTGPSYQTDFRLLDPTTGKAEKVDPDAQVWLQPMRRPYQPSRDAGVVWVAFADERYHYTMLGRYDTRRLRFRNWTQVNSLQFTSDRMWVDEDAAKIYVINDGHLLRLPLDAEVYKDWPEN